MKNPQDIVLDFSLGWQDGSPPFLLGFLRSELEELDPAERRGIVLRLLEIDARKCARAGGRRSPADFAEAPAVYSEVIAEFFGPPPAGETQPGVGKSRPAAAAEDPPTGHRLGRLLGEGGYGRVHEAHDPVLDRWVALKELKEGQAEDARQGLLYEAKVTASLQHPGIPPVHQCGLGPGGSPFYTMQLHAGPTLLCQIKQFHEEEQAFSRSPDLLFRVILSHVAAACRIVHYAHEQGVQHRDIKPANILGGELGSTRVVDWGLARLGREAAATEPPTPPLPCRPFECTPSYAAPEQAAGQASKSSDIFSLGATLYHALTGSAPYGGGRESALQAARGCAFQRPSALKHGIPPELEAVCRKAMAAEPGRRYGSAKELALDIERWLADEEVLALRDSRAGALVRAARKNVRVFLGLITGILLLLSLLAVMGWQAGKLAAANTSLEKATAEAWRQEGIATENANAAEARGEEAFKQRQLALRTMLVVLRDLQAGLEDMPGLQRLRRSLVGHALRGLAEVSRKVDSAARADRASVGGLLALGDILLDVDGAAEEAVRHYESAARIASSLPPDEGAVRTHALALVRLGNARLRLGMRGEAQEAFRTALRLHRGLGPSQGPEAGRKEELAVVLCQEGLADASRPPQALLRYGEARAVAEEAVTADEGSSPLRALALAHERLGDWHLDHGDHRKAVLHHEGALKILRRLAGGRPKGRARRDLAVALLAHGRSLQAAGRAAEAGGQFTEGVALASAALAEAPDSYEANSDLASAKGAFGGWLMAAGRTGEGGKALEEAARLWAASLPKGAAVTTHHRSRTKTLLALAESASRGGDLLAAKRHAQAAVAGAEGAADSAPDDPSFRGDLALALAALGDAQAASRDPKAALKTSRRAVQEARKTRPESGTRQERKVLALCLTRLGVAEMDSGPLSAGSEALKEAVQVLETLVEAPPAAIADRRALAAALDALGAWRDRSGDPEKALEAVRRALRQRELVAAEEPGTLMSQSDLFVSHWKAGILLFVAGEFRRAESSFRQGKAAILPLDRARKLPASLRGAVPALDGKLAECALAIRAMADPTGIAGAADPGRSKAWLAVIEPLFREAAFAKAAEAAESCAAAHPKDPVAPYLAARVNARRIPFAETRGEKEGITRRAVGWLKEARRRGFTDTRTLATDDGLAALRGDPEFDALLAAWGGGAGR